LPFLIDSYSPGGDTIFAPIMKIKLADASRKNAPDTCQKSRKFFKSIAAIKWPHVLGHPIHWNDEQQHRSTRAWPDTLLTVAASSAQFLYKCINHNLYLQPHSILSANDHALSYWLVIITVKFRHIEINFSWIINM